MSVVYGAGGIASLELETLTDATPGVRITISGVASSTVFSMSRLCEGETLPLAGWRERTIVDSDVSVDWAAPLNRPATYTLMVNGSAVASATITLPSDTAIIQDPLQPDKSIPVLTSGTREGCLTLRASALQAINYDDVQPNLIPIMGSRYPVAFGGQVQAASGFDVSLRSDDKATTDAFREMRKDAPILLLRTTEDMASLPAICYIKTKFQEQPLTVNIGGTRTWWNITGDLVAAVMQAAVTGAVTYDQVQQLLAGYTYDQVQAKAAGTTYLDWQKNPLIFSTL